MELLRYTLLADGSSDKALIPIIDWLILQHRPATRVISAFARDLGRVGPGLAERIPAALKTFPCDILFVHRDAEAKPIVDRVNEIRDAARTEVPVVPVVPVRMTEAWLFSDEVSIRFASGNANGRIRINLPGRREWEALPDPKSRLFQCLIEASDKSGRALRKFSPEGARALITQRTESFDDLRGLPSFDAFEFALSEQLRTLK